MKIFRSLIRIKHERSGFLECAASGEYLLGLIIVGDVQTPRWTDSLDEAVLYRGRDARFLANELRRVGYNARPVPYVFPAFFAWLRERQKKRW